VGSAAKPDKWELDRNEINMLSNLGAGNFGEVRLGKFKGTIDVAIKTCKANKMSSMGFLAEATKMKQLRHPNLVRLYGVCSLEDPLLIVMEYLSGGCLLDFMRTRRGKNATLNQITQMLADIANGMCFMEEAHWIHGDLAARNLLIGARQEVKICDFGHAVQTDDRNTPVKVSQQLPVRWTAPEFYRTRKCSPESDVWSFGVVMFEVLGRGEEPYNTIVENKMVMQAVMHGWRMARHKKVQPYFYELMLDCWQEDPLTRPRFSKLKKLLTSLSRVDGLKEQKGHLANAQGKRIPPYTASGPTYKPKPFPDLSSFAKH